MGPLKTDLLRLAKIGSPGDEGGGMALKAFLASPAKLGKAPNEPSSPGGGRRWNLMPDGKVLVVGVEGSTLTELCGDLPSREPEVFETADGDATDALDVLEALECVC